MDLTHRSWVVDLPDDFDLHMAEIANNVVLGQPIGKKLRWMASHKLKSLEIQKLGAVATANIYNAGVIAPLSQFKLGVVSNASLDVLAPLLIGTALAHGIALTVEFAPFDQASQIASDGKHPFYKAELDAILYAPFWQGMMLAPEQQSVETAEASIAHICDRITFEVNGIASHSGVPLIVQTLCNPGHNNLGSIDRVLSFGVENIICTANQTLVELSQKDSNILLDFHALASQVGTDRLFSSRDWYWAKQPFAKEHAFCYLDQICRLLGAMRGKSRRVLILDLDNTLWGGVIGDDGLNGISIGHGSIKGEAHLALQQVVKSLKNRGVLIAVCSKNEEITARKPFQKHPDMVLHENDFSLFVANWKDKASNIKMIAKTLNLGLDAMVFMDDNPVERAQVRQELPEVAVPELEKDPSNYADILMKAGYFESVSFTEADVARADQYAANAKRIELQTKAGDLTDFLRSLNMQAQVSEFATVDRKRITQLINKSNQFNLTTTRCTENQIDEYAEQAEVGSFDFRLKDKFGDNGLISVIICVDGESYKPGDSWLIDTWVMSCRVLGRTMERTCLDVVVKRARAERKQFLLGKYVPSDRNMIVADLYRELGFTKLREDLGNAQIWRLALDNYEPFDSMISIDFTP